MALSLRIQRPLIGLYHTAIAILVLTATSALVWLGLQAFDRKLSVHDGRGDLLTPIVPVRGRVSVQYDLIRDRVCGIDITASIIDGADEMRPLVTLHREVSGPSGPDHFTRSWQVPPEAAPGRAKLRVGWAYACPGNYVQVMSPAILSLPDVPFTITPAR